MKDRWLFGFFMLHLLATILHYTDNILRLSEYPDLPTTTPASIAFFWFATTPVGVVAYVLYRRSEDPLSYYLFYVYCLVDLVVLGHFLPSRMKAMTVPMNLKIHFFIVLEAATAVSLMVYVGFLHWRQHVGRDL